MTFLAEVADKEPTLLFLWFGAALLRAGSFLLSRWRRWTLFITAPVIVIWLGVVLDDIWSWDVGPAIIQELGYSYVIQSYVAAFAPFMFAMAGLFVRQPVSPNRSELRTDQFDLN